MKKSFILILFAILAVAVFAVTIFSYNSSNEEAYTAVVKTTYGNNIIPSEKGVFERSDLALEYAEMPIDENHQRSLKTYYNNRAFHGAPPTIPHEVGEGTIGAKSCLKCHENGGYVAKYSAYTPVVPHPTYTNCRQCHVPEKTNKLFRPNNWVKMDNPEIGNRALQSSPPIIPHDLQLRGNCLACHGGPSAPAEIRVSHPERSNCRQCHVLNDKKLEDIGVFKRK